MVTVTTRTLRETEALGRALAQDLRAGDLLLLSGDLGAGKTSLARAFIREAAGATIDVPSPTFGLIVTYELSTPIHHVDLYRLEGSDHLVELGLDDLIETGVTLVEWPDRAPHLVQWPHLAIGIEQGDQSSRIFTMEAVGQTWMQRLPTLETELISS
ncbi:MAG: tRNA (adenosine(37)-N6)-threonylcarbamoyltransferase complex ATPase subunit type 1 TsaE [Pseudomonadota bacterium]